ncbi:MAG TPA: hypothetical protein PKG56_07275 [Chitinophagaceae bacterium]|nr:hypothetical protein [Chitinophagaceae bacterium]MCC6634601.1 hypothetical protein [Chitinophagaceae bacterium]HMZ46180.1 hypothetical protein [Chitinophagaceae bacterium]HNE92602.1 hypothetical protein [Chitinophagaceae bacterium]HNL83179.1 hypothetical protein [Chitinophagaceae bacterium]
MKKLLFIMLICTAFSFKLKAADDLKVSNIIIENFQQSFPSVENVEWKISKDVVKASFNNNNEFVTAYYFFDGSYLGYSKPVALDKLPENAIRNFTKNYPFPLYNLTEVIEVTSPNGEINYYLSLLESKNGKRRILRVSEMGGVYSFND